ncbi:MAG: DUF3788 domain-containing protein [Oscillospiraceae bacterium]|nr:DUF3788 domain-containing protein [Oscillospiraceae bacterium]
MDRPTKPFAEVAALLGQATPAWEALTGQIRYHYEIDEIWQEGKPTHKHYNNLFFKRSGKALISLHLREGYFLACVVLGAAERAKFDEQRADFSAAICQVYDEAEVLHDGKWLGFELRDDALVDDIFRLLPLKRKPNRKVFPASVDVCGQLDIGLAHGDITQILMK